MTLRTMDLGGGRTAAYDDVRGEIVDALPTDAVSGCYSWARKTLDGVHASDALIATYVDDGRLILQIGPDKFDLDASDVRATKENNYRDGTIEFRISQGSRQRHFTYYGWWVGIIHPPEGVGGLPEMDREEDLFGWIFDVLEDAVGREEHKKLLLTPSPTYVPSRHELPGRP